MKAEIKFLFILTITSILLTCESRVIDVKDASDNEDSTVEEAEVVTETSSEDSPELEVVTTSITENIDRTEEDISENISKVTPISNEEQKRVEEKIEEVDDGSQEIEDLEEETEPFDGVDEMADLNSDSVTEESSINTEFEENEDTEEPNSYLTDFIHEQFEKIVEVFEEMDRETFVDSAIKSINKALINTGNLTIYLEAKKMFERSEETTEESSESLESSKNLEKKLSKRDILKQTKTQEIETCTPCSKQGYFRSKQSCRKYLECQFSTKCKELVSNIRTCPKCLKFNAKKMICDLPENVPECSYPNSKKKFCTGPGRFLVPGDCQKYYDCESDSTNGTMISLSLKTCPPETVFNHKEKKCVKGRECKIRGPKCAPGKFYLNDKFSCRKFHYCVTENESTEIDCPPNHVFNNQMCEEWGQSKLNWEMFPKK